VRLLLKAGCEIRLLPQPSDFLMATDKKYSNYYYNVKFIKLKKLFEILKRTVFFGSSHFHCEIDPLCISPIFKKRKWGREPGFFSLKFRFLEFGGGRRGSFIDLEYHKFPI